MPTPSGQIAASDINIEIGQASNAQLSMNAANVRTLAGVASGDISFNQLKNKSGVPVWVTSAGNIGSDFTQRSSSFGVSATCVFPVTYSVVSGSIPPGQTLNTATGGISGVASGVADFSSTTFTFTIRATSSVGLYIDRAFNIVIASRYVGYRCSTAGEGGTCSDTAPSGYVFNRVDFSSYGTPEGGCGGFYYGWCNAGSSNGYNPTPTTSYAVGANNGTWGDPCGGTPKRMYIQMSYGPF